MKLSRPFVVWAVLAAAAFAGIGLVSANSDPVPAADPAAATAAGGVDVPVLLGTAHAPAGRSLMAPAAGAPIRIVAVLDWTVPATTPLLAGRDCIASPARCHNGKDGVELVYAAPADIPAGAIRGTVLSDTACEPDVVGASHCLNRIRLEGGRVITVRNDHRLANEPCLAAGEHVVVAPGATAAAQLASLRALAANRGSVWPSRAGLVEGACSVSDAGLARAGITRAQLACSKSGA